MGWTNDVKELAKMGTEKYPTKFSGTSEQGSFRRLKELLENASVQITQQILTTAQIKFNEKNQVYIYKKSKNF